MGGVWSSPEVCRNGSSSLIYLVLADLVLILHFTFILIGDVGCGPSAPLEEDSVDSRSLRALGSLDRVPGTLKA